MTENYFVELDSINVSDHVEEKNGLKYLSWAFAWEIVKTRHPDANYTIYERTTEYGPVNYFTDGKTAWVKTGLTINGIEHIEELPVMDYKNRSLPLESITSFDVNKTIQRSLTKAAARHGVGLALYSGEDLPEPPAKGNKNNVPQNVVKSQEISKEDGKLPFKVLITSIGQKLKNMKATTGTIDQYNTILKEITGDSSFRCNAATEADYDIIESIYNKLVEIGY